jgi:hypothetical protein
LEQINPYAVIRSTATYEAYKAYNRKVMLAGQPYITLALVLITLGPASALGARAFLHRPAGDWRVAFACYFLPVTLAAVFMLVGVARMVLFKKTHPIPDEWRQVPRSSPLNARRKPQTPA